MSGLLERIRRRAGLGPLDVHLRSGLQAREYEAIADRLGADRPGSLLDWGAGFGHMTNRLTARGLDVTAFDWDPEDRPPEQVPFEQFPHLRFDRSPDPVALPYPDARFDAALSLGTLEHVAFPERSLAELHRVLKPGGVLYVYKLPSRRSWTEKVAKRSGAYFHGQAEHDTLWSIPEARAALERHGFAVREIRMANVLPLLGAWGLPAPVNRALWALNRLLSRAPGLRTFANNVEAVGIRR